MPRYEVTVTIEDAFDTDGPIQALNLYLKALDAGEYIYQLHNPKVKEVE